MDDSTLRNHKQIPEHVKTNLAKTEKNDNWAVDLLMAHRIQHNVSETALLVSKNLAIANESANRILKQLKGSVRKSPDDKELLDFKTQNGGGLVSAYPDRELTDFEYDLIVFRDPVDSDADSSQVMDWIKSAVIPKLKNRWSCVCHSTSLVTGYYS